MPAKILNPKAVAKTFLPRHYICIQAVVRMMESIGGGKTNCSGTAYHFGVSRQTVGRMAARFGNCLLKLRMQAAKVCFGMVCAFSIFDPSPAFDFRSFCFESFMWDEAEQQLRDNGVFDAMPLSRGMLLNPFHLKRLSSLI